MSAAARHDGAVLIGEEGRLGMAGPARLQQLRNRPEPDPVEIEPRVQTDGHKAVVAIALPYLRQVMLDDEWCTRPSRDQVREAGRRFWGVGLCYSRKRTAEDVVINFYVDAVRVLL